MAVYGEGKGWFSMSNRVRTFSLGLVTVIIIGTFYIKDEIKAFARNHFEQDVCYISPFTDSKYQQGKIPGDVDFTCYYKDILNFEAIASIKCGDGRYEGICFPWYENTD